MNTLEASAASHPIEIPNTKIQNEARQQSPNSPNSVEHRDSGRHDNPSKASSFRSDSSDDAHFRLPDGSPSFATVMTQLSPRRVPISPLAQPNRFPFDTSATGNDRLPFDTSGNSSSGNDDTTETQSPEQTSSKTLVVAVDAAVSPRSRSQSWNFRNKKVAERRKMMSLSVPHDQESKSNQSTPINRRKMQQTKTQSGTHKLVHIHPKFKILNENISVSHEDLVKGQEDEFHEEDGYHNGVKSIFDAPEFDRIGASPLLTRKNIQN